MVQKSGKMPKYEVIYNRLLREISLNYNVGDLFETQRELMKRFSASYATIGHVLRKLKEQNIIDAHVGKGIFIKNMPSVKALKPVKIAVFVQGNIGPQDKNIAGMYQQGLLEAQEKLPCEVVFLNRTGNEDDMLKQFKQTSADGILFLEDDLAKLLELVKKENIPYLVVHPVYQKHGFCVDIDDAAGIKAAVQAMAEKGAKRLLFISRTPFRGHNLIKTDAFRMGVELAGLKYDDNCIVEIEDEDDLISKLEKLRGYLGDRDKYDGILLVDPPFLELVEGALCYEQVKVPDDVMLAVFGYYSHAVSSQLSLGIVNVPYDDAARQGLEMVVKRCQGSNATSDIRLLQTKFSWK